MAAPIAISATCAIENGIVNANSEVCYGLRTYVRGAAGAAALLSTNIDESRLQPAIAALMDCCMESNVASIDRDGMSAA